LRCRPSWQLSAQFFASGEGALQNRPRQIPRRFAQDFTFRPRSSVRLAQVWVVHWQPVGNGLTALKYLAPYIFRVAISNNRILKLAEGKVTFRYRTTDAGKLETCTLPAEEFIQRFLQHVLPKGFVKVRYYGFLSSGCRPRLVAIRQQLGSPPASQSPALDDTDADPQSDDDLADDPAPNPILLCPSCSQVMQRRPIPRPQGRCPP